MRRARRGPAALGPVVLALALAGCSPAEAPSGLAPSGLAPSRPLPPAVGSPSQPSTVPVTLGGVRVQAEVADDSAEREAGLRGRPSIPPGTGMVFRFPQTRPVRFTMSRVNTPLAAAFVLRGQVVSVEQMAPCPGSVADCPTYGPPGPVDNVVETSPETMAPVRPGDRFTG